ncbi:hypothetical protein CRYUN_Cryun26dG0003000 [Craigia yunnanensis]
MQALDEEEVQMEELTKKIEELEKVLQQKNTDLENLEACRGKVVKKLSITVSKFDELHNLSESLLAEVEQLQSQLQDWDAEISLLRRGVGDVGQASSLNSEIVDVEPVINKWALEGTSTASQVRSLRKVNNDEVAIAIDMDDGSSSRLEDEDEDEDKVHGFKSLTTSRVAPRLTRPIMDMIDGLWVSCDRALMRQPALRLGIIIYWAVMHTLLAAFVF